MTTILALRPEQVQAGSGGVGPVGGVSSFGYSGTIAHALLQSKSGGVMSDACGGAPLRFRRRAFLWSEPAHPLLQRRQPAPPGCAALFRSPVAGPLHALLADHVVRGRIVFPGAAYLETARAACSAVASPSAAGAALRGGVGSALGGYFHVYARLDHAHGPALRSKV